MLGGAIGFAAVLAVALLALSPRWFPKPVTLRQLASGRHAGYVEVTCDRVREVGRVHVCEQGDLAMAVIGDTDTPADAHLSGHVSRVSPDESWRADYPELADLPLISCDLELPRPPRLPFVLGGVAIALVCAGLVGKGRLDLRRARARA
jgi:hypothetical protein